ncbi:MAG: helix-hairpin-helix domain-containing protein [Deferrisomatales bacterium]|nr:helix-hairpin-helix domain-containing protein [Deferrisomatales bacterium]
MGRRLGILVMVLAVISLAAGLPPRAAHAADKPAAGAEAPEAKVNLNTATAEELGNLPGVGEVTAKAILDFRQVNGPFRTADDLLQVRGVGEKKMETLRPLVTVE